MVSSSTKTFPPLNHPVSLRMRTSSSECTSLGAPYGSNHCSTSILSHYWWKQSFRVFGTGCDRLSARLEPAKSVIPYPSRHILSQHPQSDPSKWVPQDHQGRQNRQHTKYALALVPLRPIQTPWSRDSETLFRLKIEKTKRFMIFDPPPPPGFQRAVFAKRQLLPCLPR